MYIQNELQHSQVDKEKRKGEKRKECRRVYVSYTSVCVCVCVCAVSYTHLTKQSSFPTTDVNISCDVSKCLPRYASSDNSKYIFKNLSSICLI